MSTQTPKPDHYAAAAKKLARVIDDINIDIAEGIGPGYVQRDTTLAIAQIQATLAVADEMRALREAITKGGLR